MENSTSRDNNWQMKQISEEEINAYPFSEFIQKDICIFCGKEAKVNAKTLCKACSKKLSSRVHFINDLSITSKIKNGENNSESMLRVLIEFGQSTEFKLKNPIAVTFSNDRNIIVLDYPTAHNYRLSIFSPDGKYEKTLIELSKGSGYNELNKPKGMSADKWGNIYIADSGNNRIQRTDLNGGILGPIGNYGKKHGQFFYPCDICIDELGMLYIADTGNNRIQKITPQGMPLLIIGETTEFLDIEGELIFNEPYGVFVDVNGDIWVSDTNNHRLIKFDAKGNLSFKFGEEGENFGNLSYPWSVYINSAGFIYVFDMDNQRMQIFNTYGEFVQVFFIDGNLAALGGKGISFDAGGDFLFCNTVDGTIIRFEILL
ncbi:MAG: NHL repeat-containing protein [Desulfobacterales bacterium]|nr:NHL repeat-containing protein [Desulfobacterales bacterium]